MYFDCQQNIDVSNVTNTDTGQVLPESEIGLVTEDTLCLHQMFEAQVERSPDAIAVVFEHQQLTYQQLNQKANQLAHYLQKLGVGPEVLVGICLERSLEMVVGLLGILKAGGAYVPLDPAYPPERLAFILEDTQTPVILTVEKLASHLSIFSKKVICLDSDWTEIAQNSTENPVSEVAPSNLSYVIYTSGSTGKPKGVMIPHCGIYNTLQWRQKTFKITAQDKVLQTISFSFDPSVWQIFWPLSSGGQLIMARVDGHKDTAYLVREIVEKQITVLGLVPSILRVLLEEEGIENCQSLRHVTSGGEALPIELVELFLAKLNLENVLINCYGPTEVSIDTSCWICQQETNYIVAPIGSAIANTQIYILDEDLQPVPVGEAGELYIGGLGLARGYLNNPELTKQKFIPNPFSSKPGERLYKTGDLVRYLLDGNIEFLGRIDYQVKIRGFRVELGEIEARLLQHPAVQQTVVIAREDVPGDKRLVGYVVTNSESAPSQNQLRSFLQSQLPDYMLPSAFVFLDSLPLNPNGKIDRRALPAPDIASLSLETNFVPPRTTTEEVLAAIWSKVLRIEKIGIYNNFFELGGHSLLATQVISRVRQTWGVEIPLQSLFAHPTIAQFAQIIEQQQTPEFKLHSQLIAQLANRELIPLSFAQQRIWFLEQLEPNSAAYIITDTQRLQGQLNIDVLQKSLDAVVVEHEALRTTFIAAADGSPVQVINLPRPVELKIIDLRSPQLTEPWPQAQQILNQEAQRPFNLTSDLMLRATLIQIAAEEYILMLAMHHIASDGWSIGILWQHLAAAYAAFLHNEPNPLPKLPIQYADFAVWQHQWLSGARLETQLNYWKNQLAGATTILELPTDKPRPPVQTYRGASQTLMLPPSLGASLNTVSRQQGVTLFMTLLAAFGTLLHRYTGQADILIGTPIAGRNQAEIEQLIGFFINTVVLRTNFANNPSFVSLLAQVRETALAAYTHQDTPFEKIVEALQLERDTSRNPLFQVWFNMLNLGDTQLELPGLAVESVSLVEVASKFDLTLYVIEQTQGIQLQLVYNADLFAPERMMEMLHQFQHLLNQIVAVPDKFCSQYSLVTPQSQKLLPNPSVVLPQPDYELVTTLFQSWANSHPEQPALTQGDRICTYNQLNNIAHDLAQGLLTNGVQPGDVVAVSGTRSFGLIASMLGVFLSGGVLLTLDPNLPSYRHELMLQAAEAKYVLCIEDEYPADKELWPSQKIIYVNAETGEIHNLPPDKETRELPCIKPNDAAYVFFTSGTTGVPKGVLGCHKGLAHFLNWQRQTFDIGLQDRVGQLTALSFDVVLRDIFLPLTSGATLCLPQADDLEPTQILRYLEREEISVLHTVPSLAQSWLVNVPAEVSLRSLRWLFLAGEPLKETLVQSWRSAFPESGEIVNLYGPTETTLAKCYHRVPTVPTPGIQPVGLTLPQTQALVLTATNQLCGIGETGEIVIRTPFRSLGYINATEENQARFVANAFSDDAEDLLYYTGDRGRYRPDGLLEILGRRDHQIKIRGIRIEPGEIETVLTQHPEIFQAVVIAYEYTPGDRRLVAYLIPQPEAKPSISEIRRFLESKLPQYMIPSAFLLLDTLPLTPNGKVDRRALPAPELSRQEAEVSFVAPRNSVEHQLVQIWQEVLGIQPIGVRDNFFELGGHSLLAVKLFWQIEQSFGQKLPLAILFQSGTIEALAEILSPTTAFTKQTPTWSSLVAIQPNGSKHPFFCIHGLGGEVLCFRELALCLGQDQPFYGLQPQGLDGKQPRITRLEDMAAHYLQEIKTVQPQGPYYLGGYSFGGFVAFEMAQQLRKQGEKVATLVLLDSCRPGSKERLPFLKRIGVHFRNFVEMGPKYLRDRAEVWSRFTQENIERSKFYLKQRYLDIKPIYLSDVAQELSETDQHIGIMDVNIQAASQYNFQVYPGKAILLRTDDRARLEAIGIQYDPQFGWSEVIAGGLDIEHIPGSHLGLFKEPYVKVLAAKLQAHLDQVAALGAGV
ncbi:non-ribosomal peptide synthetase [Nostoc sp. FACHB-110]|uniref:amino acid adenylation domain-containing protein n=1 Tax=Nostoc sp. FACHB-110 TaxID=2692834 RepID=UPI0016876D23|nr:non-ribosomal peptide synthetase [Nostoc sp. FACHB-110]MBD2435731.1 amino acid adenylation domain-containing protein [Nostoc sp. FACHB-110]